MLTSLLVVLYEKFSIFVVFKQMTFVSNSSYISPIPEQKSLALYLPLSWRGVSLLFASKQSPMKLKEPKGGLRI
ncbi:MAG: hypothetical protein C4586_06220 [Anaerolineaceae bacterium]|nr:MAG: hypothetical protein C4586_06220 [Anaerolineaceae bacterium]